MYSPSHSLKKVMRCHCSSQSVQLKQNEWYLGRKWVEEGTFYPKDPESIPPSLKENACPEMALT